MKFSKLLQQPGAWIPMLLSLVWIAFWTYQLTVLGALQPQKDEGTAAHLFQIWLVLEVLMIGFFAVKWLSKVPKQAFLILIIQIFLVILVCAPVFYFHL